MIKFILEVRDELKKVTWPKRDDVVRLTSIVIVISLIVGTYLGSADFVLSQLLELLIK